MSDHEHDEHGHDSGTTSQQNRTNGGFWTNFTICLVIIIVSFMVMLKFESITVMWSMVALILTTLAYFYFGSEVLEPNEIGNYFSLSAFTHKYTPKGGFVFKIPIIEKIHRFNSGMFPLDIDYENLTMLNGDDASGKVQLTFQINPEYFEMLYKITDGEFRKDKVQEIVKKKLSEAVPAKLGRAVSILGITEGYQYEEETKKQEQSLALKLKELLIAHTNSSTTYGDDCFGLELLTIEIPTPKISGDGYDAYKATVTSQASTKLARARVAEFNDFLAEFVKEYKKAQNIPDGDALDPKVYADLRISAERQFAQSKGAEVKYFEGLSGVQPIINS